jgi:hypothetical protein
MKLISFEVQTFVGPFERIGVLANRRARKDHPGHLREDVGDGL